MAFVYLATQESLGRDVALKILAPTQDPAAGERFLREARIASSLQHPNIVPIYDFGVHEGQAYLAMEYQPAGTIGLLAGEKLAPVAALRVIRDIASALDHAHGRGVVHRDIKPENILRRSSDGAAMLSDFGIARLIQGESALTTEGTSVGTPHYMSPEQLRGGKVDGRSDLYSLGVLLWKLLTGELPYTGADAWAIGSQHLNADIPRLPPDLSNLQPLLDQLMAKNPEHRPHAGADVVVRIDGLLAEHRTPATVPVSASLATVASTRSLANPASRARAGLRPAIAVAGVLALALAGGLAWRMTAQGPASVRTSGPVASPRQRSVAVLPFVNMSDEASNQYFSDGISEELLNVLAKVDGFEVASRTSSFAFRKGDLAAAEIARRLKVNYLLEGSVRKSGNRVRITAQLVDAGKERQVWSDTYDREMTDIFAVQDEIANAIARALRGPLAPVAGRPIVVPAATRNTKAYELYLQARELFLARSHLDESVRLFERAISLDPAFARAWDGLAAAASVAESWGLHDRDYTELARGAAQKALELDPTLAQPWAALGMLEISRRPMDWERSLALMDKSLALDPRNPTVLLWRGDVFMRLGYFDRALADLEGCLALDPSYLNCERTKALILLYQGHTDAALESFRRGASQGFMQGRATSFVGPFLAVGDHPMARKLMDRLGVPIKVQPALEQALLHPERQEPASRAELAAFIATAGTGTTSEIGVSRRAMWLGDFDGVANAAAADFGAPLYWDRIPAAFRASASFKRMLEEAGIVDYWRKHGYPPQCHAVGGGFACDTVADAAAG